MIFGMRSGLRQEKEKFGFVNAWIIAQIRKVTMEIIAMRWYLRHQIYVVINVHATCFLFCVLVLLESSIVTD